MVLEEIYDRYSRDSELQVQWADHLNALNHLQDLREGSKRFFVTFSEQRQRMEEGGREADALSQRMGYESHSTQKKLEAIMEKGWERDKENIWVLRKRVT